MSVSSTSLSNDSLLHLNHFFMESNLPLYTYCLRSRPSAFIFTSYSITYIFLLLPLCIFIIYHGVQQWRQKCSTSSTATMSHSDSFTYHMVTMELIGVFGSVLWVSGIYSDHSIIFLVGFFLYSFAWFGEMFFHALTCVERYLAVVHPITYLSLRKERGIRIRNISIGCVWLLCFVRIGLMTLEHLNTIFTFSLLVVSLIIISFCSLCVLHVLIRPGPGEQGGGRKRADQSKQRAFYTIVIILGVLMLRLTWNLVWFLLYMSERKSICVIMGCGIWFNLPSSLVLPLLYLHRAGKLVCWKNNIKRG